MTDWIKTAYTFAADIVKQMITLATVIIGLEITFRKEFLTTTNSTGQTVVIMDDKWLLYLSWGLLIFAIPCGVWALMALAGSAEKQHSSIYGLNIALPVAMEMLSFLFGLILTAVFVARNLP